MLTLLKKSVEKNARPEQPAWHPNFRNTEHLPDTKTVRTTFFVNCVAVTVAVALLLFVGHREYRLITMRGDTARWVAEAEASRPASEQALAAFKTFQMEEKKFTEIEPFASPGFLLSDFLIRLGATLPKPIVINRVEYAASAVVVRGIVSGSPETASGAVSAYVDQLKADKSISAAFKEISLKTMSRAAQGAIIMEIELQFPPQSKGGAK